MVRKLNQPRYAGKLDPDFGSTPTAPGFVSILHALDWPVARDLFFPLSCLPPMVLCLYVAILLKQSKARLSTSLRASRKVGNATLPLEMTVL